MTKLQDIRVQVEDLTYIVDGPLDHVIDRLNALLVKYGSEGYYRLETDVGTRGNYDGGEYAEVLLYGWRKETEAEATVREAQNAARAEYQRQADIKKLAELKAKYGE